MSVLLESPWYNEILREGEKRGKEEGSRSGIAALLEVRFGAEGLALMPEIEAIDRVETLETLLSALKTIDSIQQVRQLYAN
jgi:predicted transposase YdaD